MLKTYFLNKFINFQHIKILKYSIKFNLKYKEMTYFFKICFIWNYIRYVNIFIFS